MKCKINLFVDFRLSKIKRNLSIKVYRHLITRSQKCSLCNQRQSLTFFFFFFRMPNHISNNTQFVELFEKLQFCYENTWTDKIIHII